MRILIAGGSGLIGIALSQYFRSKGDEVYILSRSKRTDPFFIPWSTGEKTIESDLDFDVVINLAGAGIVDKPWTNSYKEEIVKSREDSVYTLDGYFSKRQQKPSIFINASAVGFYGHHDQHLFHEDDQAIKTDFLVNACNLWEKSVREMITPFDHTYVVRIGIVLSNEGGAYPKLSRGRFFGVIPHIGTGKQYMSWIHIEDVVRLIQHLISQKPSSGPYNAVAPNPVSNKQLSQTIAKTGWFGFSPGLPAVILKAVLGERSIAILSSTNVSCQKITMTGFKFKYDNVESAVDSLI